MKGLTTFARYIHIIHINGYNMNDKLNSAVPNLFTSSLTCTSIDFIFISKHMWVLSSSRDTTLMFEAKGFMRLPSHLHILINTKPQDVVIDWCILRTKKSKKAFCYGLFAWTMGSYNPVIPWCMLMVNPY